MVAQKMIPDLVDLDEKIYDRSFTVGWLLDSLRTHDEYYQKLHGNRPVKSVNCEDVSGGKGFISVVVRCVLTFVDSQDENDTYSTIMKIPGLESFQENNKKCEGEDWFDEETKVSVTEVHAFECSFYKHLAPIMDVPVPKVYNSVEWIYQKQEGCLHMEDMTLKGKTISYFDNVNHTQVKCVIRHLAHMHKNLLECPEAWKGKFIREKEESFKKALISFEKMGRAFVEKCSIKERFEPYIEKYAKFNQSVEALIYCNRKSYKDMGIAPVIVHGDMHSGNIMWAIDSNGDVQNEIAAFVDWQISQEGQPMSDLARFLSLCADGVVRRQAEAFAVEYYLECLTKEFGNDPSKVPYTLEQLKKLYDLAFISQAVLGLGLVPFFIASKEDREPNQAIKDSYRDYGTLKALHTYEDLDRLLTGEFKDVYEKYGK